MKQIRLKNLTVGQTFTLSKKVSKHTRIYEVVACNELASLVLCNGSIFSLKNDIVVHLKSVVSVDVAFAITDEFVSYLNEHNHLVLRVNYGHTILTDEVIYI